MLGLTLSAPLGAPTASFLDHKYGYGLVITTLDLQVSGTIMTIYINVHVRN